MLKAWIEWKKLCLLDPCSTETQEKLHSFAKARFTGLLRRYSKDIKPLEHHASWHLFETHMMVKTTKQGKRYKDWLFARVASSNDDTLNIVQGGASLIMRDVVREFLHRECQQLDMLSLDEPLLNSKESSVTLLDLLPAQIDPFSEIYLHEYESLAHEHAEEFLEDMSERERIILIARHIGISLAHPRVEAITNCKKSILNRSYRGLMTRIADHLRARYNDDDTESILTLSLMTIHRMALGLIEQAKIKKSYTELFMLLAS